MSVSPATADSVIGAKDSQETTTYFERVQQSIRDAKLAAASAGLADAGIPDRSPPALDATRWPSLVQDGVEALLNVKVESSPSAS